MSIKLNIILIYWKVYYLTSITYNVDKNTIFIFEKKYDYNNLDDLQERTTFYKKEVFASRNWK